MKEIGGYLELDTYRMPMLHEGAIALNSGRNCLAYLIRKKDIKKIWVPKFLCASVWDICKREGAEISFYSIDESLKPILCPTDEWVYLVNYYGQISNEEIKCYKETYPNLIVDNVQAYFQEPVSGIDTIYTCRKFFGVTDGAFLYSDVELDDLELDESFERMRFMLGRFERTASEFYDDYVTEEEKIGSWDIRRMSKLTDNLLHGIHYEYVKEKRTENFEFLDSCLRDINKLELRIPVGPYMYPLYIDNGSIARKKLQDQKIYVPTLWSDVFGLCDESDFEYDLAKNILPVPVDQRYEIDDMVNLTDMILNILQDKASLTQGE